MNVAMTNNYENIELQGTAEKSSFSRDKLQQMLDLAESGLKNHFAKQLKVLDGKIS